VKNKKPASTPKRVDHNSTREEKISDLKSRMENIVNNKDQKHHLK